MPTAAWADNPGNQFQEVEALQTIHRELNEYCQKKVLLADELKRIEKALNETEKDMQVVRQEALKKQINLMVYQQRERECREALQDQANLFTRGGSNENGGVGATINTRSGYPLKLDRHLTQMNFFSANQGQIRESIQLSQLNAASQLILQRRTKTLQDSVTWQQSFASWIQDGPSYFDRYWRFTDPSRQWTVAQCEAMLATFQEVELETYPSLIAQSLLQERLGKSTQALESINKVVHSQTPMHFVARAVRGMVQQSLGKTREARVELFAAVKADKLNPYIRFQLARYYTLKEDWNGAEKEANFLLKSPELELDARRMLAVIYSLQAKEINSASFKAKEQATLVDRLSGDEDWFGKLLMAMALSVSNEHDEALTHGDKAIEFAADEQIPFVESIVQSIKDGSPLKWDFERN
ncbi:hypothetical protein [Planctomycetes bacterium CA13]|uniref:tetratricopeptide repeat protein n=1 Tax=Novipirellula herctigrandis TaxID=2527986 RepID=UPI0011B754E0